MKKRQRPFAREVAEMVRYAVGYRSRAFVTFGAPITASGYDPNSRTRSARAEPAGPRPHRRACTRCCRPRVFAAAMRPSITRRDLEQRIDRLIEELAARHANLGGDERPAGGRKAAEPLETRGIVVLERGRFRVRERNVLGTTRGRSSTCSSRTAGRIEPCGTRRACPVTSGTSDRPECSQRLQSLLPSARQSDLLKSVASRYGMRSRPAFARRFIAGETVEEAIAAARAVERRGLLHTLDYLGESVTSLAEAEAATRDYLRVVDAVTQAGIIRNLSLKLTQLGLDVDRASAVDNLRKILERADGLLHPHRHGELGVHAR